MMYVPCSVTQDLIIPSGLKPQHTPLILAILFHHVVIQVRSLSKASLENDKISPTCMCLGQSAGLRFQLVLGAPSWILTVLNAGSSDTLLDEETKVQDVASNQVFVSRDVIFEEGQPHRTSVNVREDIPIFETNTADTRPEPVDVDDNTTHHDNVPH
jgi:hypothetical protein